MLANDLNIFGFGWKGYGREEQTESPDKKNISSEKKKKKKKEKKKRNCFCLLLFTLLYCLFIYLFKYLPVIDNKDWYISCTCIIGI